MAGPPRARACDCTCVWAFLEVCLRVTCCFSGCRHAQCGLRAAVCRAPCRFLAAFWTGIVAVVATCAALCFSSHLNAARRRHTLLPGAFATGGVGAEKGPRATSSAGTAVQGRGWLLWTLGRIVGLYLALFYLLCVTTVYQLWSADFGRTSAAKTDAGVAWALMLGVLGLPVLALFLLTTLPFRWATRFVADAHSPNSAAQLVLGPLLAPFRCVTSLCVHGPLFPFCVFFSFPADHPLPYLPAVTTATVLFACGGWW
jgi:hypothetical protein